MATSDEQTDTDPAVVEEIRELPWVVRVENSDRADATHRIITDLSLVRTDHEIHTLENVGVSVTAYSQIGHYGIKLLVNVV